MPKETLQVSLYEIDKSLFPHTEQTAICDEIIQHANADEPEIRKFKEQTQKRTAETGDFTLRVYYVKKPSNPKWVEFWKAIIKDDQKMLTESGWMPSYIAFIWNADRMYAATGGLGNFAIQNFINQNFGADIISRLITDKTGAIKTLQERGIVGSLLGSTKYFRRDSRLVDEDEFGKFYREVRAKLDTTILTEKFGFLESEIKRGSGCIAKSSFQLNKSIDFETLMQKVLPGMDAIMRLRPRFKLNKVQLISKHGEANKQRRADLKSKLWGQLFKRFSQGARYEIDFDLCHREFDKYFSAHTTKLFHAGKEKYSFDGPLSDVDDLFDVLRSDESFDDADEMDRYMSQCDLKTYDENDNELTRGKFLAHIHGDVREGRKTYFYVDGDWYEIDNDFIGLLNEECQTVIRDNYTEELMTELWRDLGAGRQEDDYNAKYIGKENTVVLHKVKPDGIELCDVLKWDETNVYLIHVKEGFNNMMRDLTYQSYLSARRVFEDRKSDLSFLGSIYDQMASAAGSGSDYMSRVGNQANAITREAFVNLFKEKKPVSVIAIVDTSERGRDIRGELSEFNSNIAKFTTIDLYKKLRSQDFGFRAAQIQK